MSKILLPIGMIGSGKSTWARQYIKDHPTTKIVGGDEIRYMLHGGEYVHDPMFEEVVIEVLRNTAVTMAAWGWDVILDECYCSLSRQMRWDTAKKFPGDEELIAVVFPERDMQHHIDDKILKGLRGKTVNYWKRVFCEMEQIYEPFSSTEEYFSEVICVEN